MNTDKNGHVIRFVLPIWEPLEFVWFIIISLFDRMAKTRIQFWRTTRLALRHCRQRDHVFSILKFRVPVPIQLTRWNDKSISRRTESWKSWAISLCVSEPLRETLILFILFQWMLFFSVTLFRQPIATRAQPALDGIVPTQKSIGLVKCSGVRFLELDYEILRK